MGDDNFLLPVQVGPISSLSARHQLTVRPNFPESQPLSIDTWKIGKRNELVQKYQTFWILKILEKLLFKYFMKDIDDKYEN